MLPAAAHTAHTAFPYGLTTCRMPRAPPPCPFAGAHTWAPLCAVTFLQRAIFCAAATLRRPYGSVGRGEHLLFFHQPRRLLPGAHRAWRGWWQALKQIRDNRFYPLDIMTQAAERSIMGR